MRSHITPPACVERTYPQKIPITENKWWTQDYSSTNVLEYDKQMVESSRT